MNAPAKDNNTFEVVEFDSGTLYNGDCLDVMATLPDNSVDTVITDPPHGLFKEAAQRIEKLTKKQRQMGLWAQ